MFVQWLGSLLTIGILMSISFVAGMIFKDERRGK
ncbi:hypothetical protein [Flyfo myovirus Tbat2_7]|nr:hypothetical protein [Flyfo myovirus Tbat2_7]